MISKVNQWQINRNANDHLIISHLKNINKTNIETRNG